MFDTSNTELLYPFRKELDGKLYIVFKHWQTRIGVWYMGVEISPEEEVPWGQTREFSTKFIFEANHSGSGAV